MIDERWAQGILFGGGQLKGIARCTRMEDNVSRTVKVAVGKMKREFRTAQVTTVC